MNDATVIKLKQILRYIWLALVVVTLSFYFFFPQFFTVDYITTWLGNNAMLVLVFYLVASSVRALLLLPSTIFVLLGIALYPNEPFFVLITSIAGIMIGASLMYWSASFLTPATLFGNQETKIALIKEKMEKYGFWIVLFWSFFPAVPTDLICFTCGSIKYHYGKFFIAVLLGEIILVSVYIFTGVELFSYLLSKL